MSSAPKSSKAPSSAPTTAASGNPSPKNKPSKAPKSAATGKPVQDQAAAPQAVRVDGIPASTGLGTLMEPWQARDELAKALNDLEALNARVQDLSTHFDTRGLTRHIEGARKWLGNELGLEVNKDGVLQRADGGTQLSSELTSDSDAHENASGDVKTPEGKAAGEQTTTKSSSRSKSTSKKSK